MSSVLHNCLTSLLANSDGTWAKFNITDSFWENNITAVQMHGRQLKIETGTLCKP